MPITRSQKLKGLEEQLLLVSTERDVLRAERDDAQDLAQQYKAQLDESVEENKKLREQVHLLQQVLQCPTIDLPRLHINALPDVPQRKIFAFLPPKDVLQMARVCRVWQSHQQRILSKVNSIVFVLGSEVSYFYDAFNLFINPHAEKLIKEDNSPFYPKRRFNDEWFQIRCSSLRMNNIRFLIDSMTNIVTLKIIIRKISFQVLDQVMELLSTWSSRLITLKVWCSFAENTTTQAMTHKVLQLLSLTNSLTELKHFTLYANHHFYTATGRFVDADQFLGAEPHFMMPNLSRLVEFNVSINDRMLRTPLYYSLKHYVPQNPHLNQLKIGLGRDDLDGLMIFAEKCPNVAARVCAIWQLDLQLEFVAPAIQPVLSKYENLTKVGYTTIPQHLSFSQVIYSFSSSKQLVRLGLYLNPSEVVANRENNLYPLSKSDNTPPAQIHRLTSVKMLTLTVIGSKHSDFESRHWGWAFPNVHVLEMYFRKTTNRVLLDERQMVQTFLQCPKLQLIFTRKEGSKWREWSVLESASGRTTFEKH